MNIKIKHRFTGKVLFSVEAASLKAALEIKVGEDADLRGADLRGADLGGAYLGGAHLIDAGQDRRGYRFVGVKQEAGYMIHAGCRWYTTKEAKAHWNHAHDNDEPLKSEILAKLRLIAATAKARGWNMRKLKP